MFIDFQDFSFTGLLGSGKALWLSIIICHPHFQVTFTETDGLLKTEFHVGLPDNEMTGQMKVYEGGWSCPDRMKFCRKHHNMFPHCILQNYRMLIHIYTHQLGS